jgi:hypothetical protein
VAQLLPASFLVREATLMAEFGLDRWRVQARLPFGGGSRISAAD